ncbi:MAG TPA: Crp/Fnr family transcriptional regulator [Candidatus Saccharimonadales bacterium]|nr:Crp/Fnr family transcriptional regulator [Candidatus Saccharimonadales bacterium]
MDDQIGDKTKSRYDHGIDLLFKEAREKKYPKNQIIAYQGDTLSAIYLIKKGYVKAYTILDTGDTRTMFILGPGDIFPIAFSLTLDWESYQLKYFYQTLAEVSLNVLDNESFKRCIDTKPEMSNIYMSYMSASNQAIMGQLEAMKNKTAKSKIMLLLPYLVEKIGQKTGPNTYKLVLKLSHQEIADLSGITRETTTALLKELEKDGVIKQQRNTWIIHLDENLEENLLG